MGKNYMPEVARMLGVEIGEEFDVLFQNGCRSAYNPYRITADEIVDCAGNGAAYNIFIGLLNGECTPKKRPWRPKEGELFWTINGKGDVEKYHFSDYMYDLALLNMGNCFPTKKAALAAVPEMLEKFEEIKKGVRE